MKQSKMCFESLEFDDKTFYCQLQGIGHDVHEYKGSQVCTDNRGIATVKEYTIQWVVTEKETYDIHRD
jgi:hypothetical protein